MSTAKKFLNRFSSLFLCLLVILLTGCQLFGDNNNSQLKKAVKLPPDKQVYVAPEIGISDITTLDPALASDTASINAIQMIFTGLVQVDDKLQVHPQLARSWDVSSDGLSWTFHLRSNLKFSDGTLLTSRDVAYSIDRALQPATQSTVAPNYLALIRDSDELLAGRVTTLIGDSILPTDKNTLVIMTKKKVAYFLQMLTYPCSYVVEKSLIEKYGAKFTDHLNEGGSTGPFKIAQYIHKKEIDFVPNPNYYSAKPQLSKVTFPFYPNAGDAYRAYLNGEVDTTSVPLSTFGSIKKRSDFHQVPQLWINYYTMNYLVKPFDNIHIRQAFALAIDKTAIANTVWKGTVLPTNHIVPQGMAGYNPHLKGPDGTQGLKGNPTKARQLLQQGLREEGWSSITQMPAITLTYATIPGNPAFDQEAAALISMWQKVLGVTVRADPLDFNTLLDKVTASTNSPKGLQFWGLSWVAEYPDPEDWLTLQFDKGVPYNNMNYGQNTTADAALQQAIQQQLEAADANSNENARLQAYQQAEQQLINDVAWLPVEQVASVFLRTANIVGIVDNGQGLIPPDDWAKIYRVTFQ